MAPEFVFLVFEHFLQPSLIERGFVGVWRVKVHVAVGRRIVVGYVAVGLRVVAQHTVVPVGGISEPHVGAHDYREFPVAAVIQLSQSRAKRRHPQRAVGVGVEFPHPIVGIHRFAGRRVDHCHAVHGHCSYRRDLDAVARYLNGIAHHKDTLMTGH